MSYAYHRPRSLDEAQRLKASLPGSLWIAGGTDMMVRIKGGRLRPPALVSLRGVDALRGVTVGDEVTLGALTTLGEIAAHPVIIARYPMLVQAMLTMGSVQIRNAGTLGGNLANASPCADSAPPLLVLNARVLILGADGEREVPIVDLFEGPGATCLGGDEVLTRVVLPPPERGMRGVFTKKTRVKVDLGLASAAVLAAFDGSTCTAVRIAAGAVAPIPLRLSRTEAVLRGKTLDNDVLDLARQTAETEVEPITDIRAGAAYRRRLIGVYVRRSMAALLAGSHR
jgi:CO/xanthine dehydrogenase FAD-binding subunit